MKDIDILVIPGQHIGALVWAEWYKGTAINVFVTTARGWGAGMIWRTGPAVSNIGLCVHYAKPKGLLLNVNGVWDRTSKAYLGGRTEHEVAKLLGWKWKAPEERGH